MKRKSNFYKWIRSYTIRDTVILSMLAAVLSLFLCIGDSFQQRNFLIYLCRYNMVFGYLSAFIIYFIMLLLIMIVIDKLVEVYRNSQGKTNKEIKWKYIKILFLVAWLPYIIAYFPGSITHDGMVQINIAGGAYPLSNAHPIISTAYMAIFVKIGKILRNDYIGIFLYVIVQSLIMAFALTYMLKFLYSLTKSKPLIYVAVIFFTFYPTWGMMVESVIKDTLYTAFFILFATMFSQMVLDKENKLNDKKFVFAFILSMLGICFWRNNGIHIIILSFIVLLLSKTMRKYKRNVVGMLTFIMVVYYVMNAWMYPLLNVSKGSKKEMLSVPFQQTARYLRDYPEDVTEDEKNVISAILNYEDIPRCYSPNIADPVKNTFNGSSTKNDLKKYFFTWFKMFLRHPGTYFAATFNNTYNYYYFKDMRNFMAEYQSYTKWELNEILDIDENGFKFLNQCKRTLAKYVETVQKIPIINHLGRCGVFTWAVVIAFALLFRRREYSKMLLCVPLFCAILICIASPVNGLQRYMWCVMGSVWIPIAACLSKKEQMNNVK